MESVPAWLRQRSSLLALAALALAIFGGAWLLTQPSGATEIAMEDQLTASASMAMLQPAESTPAPTAEAAIVVYITGAVRSPDVYSVPTTARAKDLVVAAGGLTDDADIDQINLAERLTDGQHVHILRRGEQASAAEPASTGEEQIDLNTASAADLEALPGIGVVLAQHIIDYRAEHGPFQRIDDLQEIKGIGGSVYDKIVPHVRVSS